ncbi:SPL family radical SAM protein [Ulvibacterium marinum]|uniref:Radical SAM protein n=1 Tax=Ulvibacterium marinum TaxID=2419782 RepID=A0A3B0C265_9FLAO|nr:radical SAM protein [Ulvibacterium marinum]RKN79412.1 radical SAM protein [Ulvibacterium marinum]
MPREIHVKSVLNKTKKRDQWFLDDYTFNPYSSCSFNCLYCYIRGSKYGSNLEQSLSVKTNAIELLDKQLATRAKKNQYGVIVLSSATDPYIQIEKKYRLTRQALEIIHKHRFPVHMITKSDMIVRDFDLLKKIERDAILPLDLPELKRGVIISFSFSTIQDKVGKIFEPGATLPSKRIEALKQTIDEEFLTGVSLMPLIPFISDTSEQLHQSFSLFKRIGIDYIFPATITLFGNGKADSRTLMLNAINKHYPELREKYDKFFSANTEMPTYYQNAFRKKIKELCKEYGLKNDIIKTAANSINSQ